MSPISWRREHWVLASVAVALTVIVGMIMPTWANAMRREEVPSVTTLALPLPALSADQTSADDRALAGLAAAGMVPGMEGDEWKIVIVRAGQSLADIFHEQGLSPTELQRLVDAKVDEGAFRRIHPGDEFAFRKSPEGKLAALRFDRDDHTRVVLRVDAEGVKSEIAERALERRVHVAHGSIKSSLFEAGDSAGMTDSMTLKLAQAFGYDIDFAQDLRVGDSFTVIYNDVYRDGERLRDGDILGATFVNGGRRFTAFRYQDTEGGVSFYSEDGRPLKTSFLRTPVEFTRISSRFSAGRMHPVLGRMRAHKGVDYAAPTGTPIYAAGDAKVEFRGVKNGFGNVVILQHGGQYSTVYGHMSRFASGLSAGQRVRQGQLIGYVGSTGLATGPHLHYEFRLNGQHRDPLTVTLPKPEPLPSTELAKFKQLTQPMLAQLKRYEDSRLAMVR
ncbi:MAG TPA: peptidoglycan DD-metalloendopeptidase family protein [Tahibacter sp.]|uniref:OapA family protein n=1 Tax=Tahibacter sp. TaxID=2056211 RepID=UPI002B85CEFA|nr:peptidoglycan DD-metalloendopeptidase family protein [Tahibacter sp.]HSX61034.1 peptidoglycan DD-metalloendopeptidase family protein [Tahibacter sp.]